MITNKRDVRDSLIMIKPLPVESVTKSGLLLDFQKAGQRQRGDQPVKGIAVSVPEIFKADIPEGSFVLYEDLNGGYFADFEGEPYFWTKPMNILAVMENPENVHVPIFGVQG